MIPVTYTALCRREGNWWVITVPELEYGSVTQARTLDEVPSTVADLVATMTGQGHRIGCTCNCFGCLKNRPEHCGGSRCGQ